MITQHAGFKGEAQNMRFTDGVAGQVENRLESAFHAKVEAIRSMP
jgi:hypothetical protein